jgi:hypothetical protein
MPNDDIGNDVDHTADRFIGTVVDDAKVGNLRGRRKATN